MQTLGKSLFTGARNNQKTLSGICSFKPCSEWFYTLSVKARFCSKRCANKNQQGTGDKRYIDPKGYVIVPTAEFETRLRSKACGRKVTRAIRRREHLVIMEKLLGRKLEKDERVHHKNGIRHDNRASNLELIKVYSQFSGARVRDIIEYIQRVHPEKMMRILYKKYPAEYKRVAKQN